MLRIMVVILIRSLFLVSRNSRGREWSVHFFLARGFEGFFVLIRLSHLGFRGFWLTSAIRQLFDLQVYFFPIMNVI